MHFRCASFHTPSCIGALRLAFESLSFAISTESQVMAVQGGSGVQHFTLKTDPLKREDLDECVSLHNPKNRR